MTVWTTENKEITTVMYSDMEVGEAGRRVLVSSVNLGVGAETEVEAAEGTTGG